MSWKRERDSLIAQTMAFVQSVTGRKDDYLRSTTETDPSPGVLDVPQQEFALKTKPSVMEPPRAAAPPLSPVPAASMIGSHNQGEVADEIRARIASFRAHQERFNREREEYFSQTLAKLRAELKDTPPPRLDK